MAIKIYAVQPDRSSKLRKNFRVAMTAALTMTSTAGFGIIAYKKFNNNIPKTFLGALFGALVGYGMCKLTDIANDRKRLYFSI